MNNFCPEKDSVGVAASTLPGRQKSLLSAVHVDSRKRGQEEKDIATSQQFRQEINYLRPVDHRQK